jgi:hypothetical protein
MEEKSQKPDQDLDEHQNSQKSLDLCTVIPPEYDIKMYCSF